MHFEFKNLCESDRLILLTCCSGVNVFFLKVEVATFDLGEDQGDPQVMSETIKDIVFDLGGVLIDWNPRYLYRKIFVDRPEEMEKFLSEVCTQDWNEQQDGGRTFAEGIAELLPHHPHYQQEIHAYFERWTEMLKGPIAPVVEILERLRADQGLGLYALTNWSAETFPFALERFAFLSHFQHIVVSGRIGMKKPDPDIFHHLIEVTGIIPQQTLFIDDSRANIQTAQRLGFLVEHFQSADELKRKLASYGLNP